MAWTNMPRVPNYVTSTLQSSAEQILHAVEKPEWHGKTRMPPVSRKRKIG